MLTRSTPPQKFESLIDTGSSVMWVIANCTSDAECGRARVFNGSESSTLLQTTNPYEIQYGRGSAAGHTAHDQITVGGQKAQAAFVMVDELTEWGMSISSLIGFAPRSSSWFQRVLGNWAEPVFGLYLGRSTEATEVNPTPGNGLLTLGGVDSSKFSGDLHWIDANATGWWTIPLEGLKLDGQDVDLTLQEGPYSHMNGHPAAVIDSGTTLINGPRAAISDMYSKLNATEISSGLYVFPCTGNGVPALSLTFGGVEYKVHPDDTVMGASTVQYIRNRFNVTLPGADTDYYCRAAIDIFEPPGESFRSPSWIVGAAFMRSVYTAHRMNPPAIGFAPVADSAGGAAPTAEGGVQQNNDGKVTQQNAQQDITSGASTSVVGAGLASVALIVALAAL
jgi:cathepsin D